MSNEILVSMDREGVHIVSPEVAEALEKKKISASMISSLENCPASWAANTFVIPKVVEQESDNAMRRGSMFHKVMELVFEVTNDLRGPELIIEKMQQVLESDEFKDLAELEEPVEWLKDAVRGYYAMGGNPKKVDVATITRPNGKEELGLEVFVAGQLGEAKRSTIGFIDRLIKNTKVDDDSIIVEDWKTGAKAKEWNPKTKNTDGLAEARQQVIYTMLLEQMGIKVSEARLIFPVARKVVNIDIHDEEFRKRVLNDIYETDKKLDTFIENNTFEYNPNFLCSWCPLAKACPVADLKPFQKARDAYNNQPEIDILARGIEFL